LYQSIYFDRSTYNIFLRDDKSGWHQFKHNPIFYKRVKHQQDGALPVLTGGYCIPVNGKADWSDPDLLEKDINPELYTLRELYYNQEDVIPEWHNTVFLDIEIEMGGALTIQYIKDAQAPITSIALIDLTTKTKICFIVDKSREIEEINDGDTHIIPCRTERELILKFLDKWEEIDPTIVVGWNSEYFDMPYLYFRLGNIVHEEDRLRLSPIRKIQVQDYNPNVLSVRLGGINHLDYMLLHKKYITKEEPSYKLGDIGEKYVKLGKVEYEGNLNTLFKTDKQKFIEYNLRDVEIVEKLEEKLKFIELTISLSHICNIPYDQIYYSTVMGEAAILKYLKRKGIVSPNKPTTTNPSLKGDVSSYAGGYIKTPQSGVYNWLFDIDFSSLYPSIIKSLNLGIETLVGRIVTNDNYEQNNSLEKLKERDPNEIVTIQRLNKLNYTLDSKEIKLGKLIQIIEDNDYSLAASGAFFDTKNKSCICKILEEWYDKREHFRELKKKAGKEKKWDLYNQYDVFQQSFKILQNQSYGTYKINSWRYTDGHVICSAAITNSGQRLTKSSIEFVNDLIDNKILKLDKEEMIEYFNLS
jgi:DNA polymerase elongation subunit (family B)